MRSPTPEQAKQERILLQGLSFDAFIWIGYFVVALQTGMLTLIAECVKGGVTIGLTTISVILLRRINRGRMQHYDFGTGKVEQAISLLSALAVICAAAFISFEIVERLREIGHEAAGAHHANFLALAIVSVDLVVDIALCINLSRSAHGLVSPVFTAEHRARIGHLVISGVVLLGLTIAQFTHGAVSAWADILASAGLALFLVWLAVGIVKGALPDLLDRTLSEELQLHINRALIAHFDRYEQLGRVRSRQAGSRYMVDIELGFSPSMTMGEVAGHLAAIQTDLERDLPGSHVVLVPKVAS